MKSKLTHILVLILALTLAIGLCVFSVGAQNEDAIEVTTAEWINPYCDQAQFSAKTEQPTVAATPSTYHTTFEAAMNAARIEGASRKSSFVIGYKTSQAISAQSALDGYLEHTGNPKHGDYLRWNAGRTGVSLGGYTSGGYYYYSISYTVEFFTTSAQEAQVDTAVTNLINQLGVKNGTNYQKAKAVYDYMCKNIVYDYEGLYANDLFCHSAYSAIIEHETVCQGYASMFYRMMLEMGVGCRVVAGDANSYATGSGYGNDDHGWNIVKMGNYYYNLDSTWDAELHPNGKNYEYFLLNDSSFTGHIPWSEYQTSSFKSTYPKSSTNYNHNGPDNSGYSSGDQGSGGNGDEGNNNNNTQGRWYQSGGKWYYEQNGSYVKGWKMIGGKWYYFNTRCVMVTGWNQISGKWYYFTANGDMVTGWKQLSGKWYYFTGSGDMVTGWKQLSGKWYYFRSGGDMATGWLQQGGSWYYLKSSGEMATSWLKLGGSWYYLKSSGAMATGALRIGNKMYIFNSNGVCLNP